VPTSRVTKKLPPKSPEKPTLTKAVTKRAEAPAIRRSQARGVLTLTLPKTVEAQKPAKKIEVKAAA